MGNQYLILASEFSRLGNCDSFESLLIELEVTLLSLFGSTCSVSIMLIDEELQGMYKEETKAASLSIKGKGKKGPSV